MPPPPERRGAGSGREKRPAGRSRAWRRAPSLKSPPEGERPEGRAPTRGACTGVGAPCGARPQTRNAGPGDHPWAPTRGAPTGGMDSRLRGNDGWGQVRQRSPEEIGRRAPLVGACTGVDAPCGARPQTRSVGPGDHPWATTRVAPTGGVDPRLRGNDGWGGLGKGLRGRIGRRAPLVGACTGVGAPCGARPQERGPRRPPLGDHKGRPYGRVDPRLRGNDGWGQVRQRPKGARFPQPGPAPRDDSRIALLHHAP